LISVLAICTVYLLAARAVAIAAVAVAAQAAAAVVLPMALQVMEFSASVARLGNKKDLVFLYICRLFG
jgi:hypothetical protein